MEIEGAGLGEIDANEVGGIAVEPGRRFVTPHHVPGRFPVVVELADGTVLSAPVGFGFDVAGGPGHFVDSTAERLPAEALAVQDAAVADFDGDGDPDVMDAQGGATGQNRLFLNVGAAGFVAAPERMPVVAYGSADVVLADLDGDGKVDVYFAGYGVQDRLFLGR